ncbi:MAG: radical SAM protein [Candidatus Desulforudis sp.]|nr:radical SAM protein [Desulforudis sp.]
MGTGFVPAYRHLGLEDLRRRAGAAYRQLKACGLCGRMCKVNRMLDETGICRATRQVLISGYGPHFGEEAPLVGDHGSGTIFMTYCNLKCIFCQNYDISWEGTGDVVTVPRLAKIMLELQRRGCHNVNFVSPTHYVPQILAAVYLAARDGLKVPLVYNTGGYDSLETLGLLDGVVDIYMPDVKYMDAEVAKRLSGVADYPVVVKAGLREMQRQVGDLVTDRQGIATRGLLVRHLVLPGGLAGTEKLVEFLAEEVSPDCFINVMGQYYPAFRARRFPPLDRRPTREELRAAVQLARDRGLRVYT